MTDLNSRKHQERIQQDKAMGKHLGVNEVPSLFINGKKLVGSQSTSALEIIVEQELGRLAQMNDALINARKHIPSMVMNGAPDLYADK